MEAIMSNLIEFQNVYNEIQSCHICPGMDPEKALRRIDAVNQGADVFIILQ
jgi:hypothetical protein